MIAVPRVLLVLVLVVFVGPRPPLAAQDPPPATDAVKEDQKTLKEADIADEPEALLNYFRQRTVSDEQRGEIVALIRQMGDASFEVRQQASSEVVKFGLAAVGPLREAERGSNYEIALRANRALAQLEKVPSSSLSASVARRLAHFRPAETAEVLLAHLPYADDESVADEIRTTLTAVAIQDEKPNPVLLTALKSGEGQRRGAAAEAIVRANLVDIFLEVRALASDPTVEVDVRARIALVLVTEAREKAMMPNLIELMADAPLSHGWRIESMLCSFAGDEKPKETLGTNAADRQATRDAWLAWWDKNAATVDLSRLDEGPPLLGYTLVLEIDSSNSVGSLVEVGAAGDVRWRMEDLTFPIDLQVLPGEKFLIAEHNGHRVTERDRTGKIYWTQNVSMPVSCRRLSNGNTFIACRNHLHIYDPKGKQVWEMGRPQHDVVHARMISDDEIVFMTNTGKMGLIEMKTKKVLKEFTIGQVQYWSSFDLLPNRKVLLTQYAALAEYDLDQGKGTGWTQSMRGPTSVQRLINGNTLANSMNDNRIVEMDVNGKVKWEYRPKNAQPWRAFRR